MHSSDSPERPASPDRRDFVKKAAAVSAGAVAAAVPIGAGIVTLLDPLRHKSSAVEPVRVASLDALPADGTPRKFEIYAARADAWNKYPDAPVGAVYLRKTSDTTVEALNVVCPHFGCFVDYLPGRSSFFCPCHNSSFGLDGSIADPRSPSPRPLDTLDVEIRNGNEIWVKFQNFRAGTPEKIPVA